MHIVVNPPKCSKCGAKNSEEVFYNNCHIKRCVDCGHEKILSILTTTTAESDGTKYVQSVIDEQTF